MEGQIWGVMRWCSERADTPRLPGRLASSPAWPMLVSGSAAPTLLWARQPDRWSAHKSPAIDALDELFQRQIDPHLQPKESLPPVDYRAGDHPGGLTYSVMGI